MRPRYEKMVSPIFRYKGLEEYLSLYRMERCWSDSKAEGECPLLPNYLFCQLDFSRRLVPLHTTPGVLRLVGAGKVPVAIDDHELEAVRAILRSGIARRQWPLPRLGDRVCIEDGPPRGLEGMLVAERGKCGFPVSVTLLQRAVAVEIDAAWATPVGRPKAGPAGTTVMPFGLPEIPPLRAPRQRGGFA